MTTIREAQAGVAAFHDKHGFRRNLLHEDGGDSQFANADVEDSWDAVYNRTGLERLHMVGQEASELALAWRNQDLVKLADGLADLLYVTLGCAAALGIDVEPLFDEVHRSNMTKDLKTDRDNMHPKGPNYQPPQLEPILKAQGLLP